MLIKMNIVFSLCSEWMIKRPNIITAPCKPRLNLYDFFLNQAYYYIVGQVIKIRSGNLFDYEGEHRTYVMRFQETSTEIPTPDLILVIEVEDVKEASDTGSLSSGSSGCCDDISTIRWMVPAFTAVVLVVLIVSCSILLIWCVQLFSICRIFFNARNTKFYHEKHTK